MGQVGHNAIILPPHDAALAGHAAISKGWSTFPAHKDWRTQPLEIGGQGDVAYVRGEWSIVMTPANQPEQPDAGKYLHVWRRLPNGTWKLQHDIWNSDLPAQ
ncbi:MAG: hypothetical protein Q7S40_05990 [Opitutaceae bacterium]|nr:hypothetical protein [Opitutaceae bacterium]